MAKNGKNPSERERLLEELRQLRESIDRHSDSESGDAGTPLLALATLRRGLDLKTWNKMVEELQLDDWLAVPCAGDEYPALERMLDRLEELAHQTEHDPLTGLLNRRGFERSLSIEMERAQRFTVPLSLALIDIDDFKQANDRFGHPAGDRILVFLADLLKQRTRKINVAARVGGEEFAVLLPGSGQLQAQAMLLRIQEHFGNRDFQIDGGTFRMTFSAGVAGFDGRVTMAGQELVNRADAALYRAKKAGKNRTLCATAVSAAVDHTAVERGEREALYTIAKPQAPQEDDVSSPGEDEENRREEVSDAEGS